MQLRLPTPSRLVRHPVRLFLRILAAFIVVALGYLGWQAYRVYRAVTEATGRQVARVPHEPVGAIPPVTGTRPFNILVLGSDTDKKQEEAAPLTQSMIVVTVDPVHQRVAMLSIPRDFWVSIPDHRPAKVDLAFKYGYQSGFRGEPRGMAGGVALARYEVERLFHIPIHYYAWVGLDGFINVIDTFGGINLDVSHPILDDSYPNDLSSQDPYGYRRVFIPPGWQHLSGAEALQYVRSRHGDRASDFGRSARQQQVLLRLEQKINTMNVLMNLPQLADELRGSVRTDLTIFQLYDLARLARHIDISRVNRVVLQAPTYCQYGTSPDGQSILVPNWPAIRHEVKTVFASISSSRPGPQPTAVVHVAVKPRATPASKVDPAKLKHAATPRTASAVLSMSHLPGNLIFVRDGNLFELKRGGQLDQLTGTADASMPAPSPDGRSVAFVRFGKYWSDLWVLDLRTSHRYAVTRDKNDREIRNSMWAAWPTWQPGNQLVFSWDNAKLSTPPSDARPTDLALWEMPTLGGTAARVSTPVLGGGGGDTQSVGRPGHSQVAYVTWNFNPQNNQPYSQLVLLDLTTRQTTYLTPPRGRVLEPAWDPSGKRLTFVRNGPHGDEVVVASLIGARHGLTLGPSTVIASGQVAQPAFTPDGKWVSYLRMDGNGASLYLIPSIGGPSQELTVMTGHLDPWSHPFWTR